MCCHMALRWRPLPLLFFLLIFASCLYGARGQPSFEYVDRPIRLLTVDDVHSQFEVVDEGMFE